MGPNEIDLVRVYTAPTGQTVADVTPLSPGGTSFDVVVEAEAGSARVDGVPYTLSIFAYDLSSGTSPAGFGNFSQTTQGIVFGSDWPRFQRSFPVNITNINAVNGNVMAYVAVLQVGLGVNRVTKFAISPLFIIQQS